MIAEFTYGDENPWPQSADGDGYSLIFSGGDLAAPLNWRTSIDLGGNPGSDDGQTFSGGSDQLVDYALAGGPVALINGTFLEMSFLQNLSADDVTVIAEYSTNLSGWIPLTSNELVSRRNQGDGTTLVTYRTPLSPGDQERQFTRVKMVVR